MFRFIAVYALFMSIAFAGLASARSVYLKDGAILDCESFWHKGDSVIVKVNRDTILKFADSEVNLEKTFMRYTKRVTRHRARRTSASGNAVVVKPQGLAAAAVPSVQEPAMTHEVKTVPAPVPTAQPAEKAAAGKVNRAGGPGATGTIPAKRPIPKLITAPKANVTPAQAALLAKLGTTGVMIILVVLLIFALVMIVAQWKIYEKAGQAGWKCLVPLYNMYVMVLICGKPWWWFLLLLIPVVSVAIYLLMMLALAERFGKGPLFGVGLFFLPFICFPVLAFDGSVYLGQPVAA